MNQVIDEYLGRNSSHSTYGWKVEPSNSRVPLSKFESSYLRVEGWTKPPTSALVQNLSPSTYRWKDEPSHSRVSWLKFKFFYQRVEVQIKSLTNALVKIEVFLPSGGKKNQASSKCLVQYSSPSTYGWKDEASHSRVSWSKFKSYLRVEGLTKSLTSALVKI